MKRRMTVWASVGFFVGCCWVALSFLLPPELFFRALRQPLIEAAFVTCPVLFAAKHYPLQFWWVPLINAVTYAVVGGMFEAVRAKMGPRVVN